VPTYEYACTACAEHIEVDSSHTGMSVNARVYRQLAQILDQEAERWTG